MDNDENIIEVFYDYNDTLPSELVPFAFDPAGNLICFDYKNHEEDQLSSFGNMRGMGKETLMESEGITAEETEEVARENVFYIANDFTEF